MKYPFHYQLDSYDCGPTCLKMVAEYYGKKHSLESLRESSFITRNGVSLLGISQAAEKIGLRTLMAKLDTETLENECPLPAILHWNQDHFIVLYDIRDRSPLSLLKKKASPTFVIGDPGHGIRQLKKSDFEKSWQSSGADKGIALFLEPVADFYVKKTEAELKAEISILIRYLRPFKKQISILFLYMVLATVITISFPYLTKGIIDKGVVQKSKYFVTLFAISQLVLFLSSTVLDILRSWLLLHMNAKISLHIISDFLKKLLKLPIRFFDSKSVGDVSQRINDHHRIESFLTGDLVTSAFSVINIIVFSFILLFYQVSIWLIFITLSIIAVSWIFLFQKKRMQLDYIRFNRNKNSQEKLFELIVGMQEIKLNGSEDTKRWDWEFLQQRLYKLNIKGLSLEQYQQTGFVFLTHLKNIIISYLAAIYVMNDTLSFGTMLSISFIIGQTNGPLEQLIRFFKSAQDAKLSLSRLQEVHRKENEEKESDNTLSDTTDPLSAMPASKSDINIINASFQYQGPRSPFVLKNLNFTIKHGQVTAIIGPSGSGKSTLMKILLGFYNPIEGQILADDLDLKAISPRLWRSKCGSVMQDGYIFSDTIKRNIALSGNDIDLRRFENAVDISNVNEFVKQLPIGYNTLIGSSGLGLSGGQKQRILIARAIYKNPDFIFFDEATSSLDANNERQIMDKLDEFFKGKTVVIIAHRLSTVKNADQIVVLDKGEIVEIGNHDSLIRAKGKYYSLVKNQLELGD
jgi:ATP-binding cassette subfamily B protein